jgi:hypothetical protein
MTRDEPKPPPIAPAEIIGSPKSPLDHYIQCPGCGAWADMRDLGMVFAHAGDLPHGPGVKQQ